MTAIHLEGMMYRDAVPCGAEPIAGHALLRLIPPGGAVESMGANVALVIDVSGSMFGDDGTGMSRIRRVKQAAITATEILRPTDVVSVVAFCEEARTVWPAQARADAVRLQDAIRGVDRHELGTGGTSMDQGMIQGLTEVRRGWSRDRVNLLVLLTDGETTGAETCLALAREAAEQRIQVTTMGIGLEWNEALLTAISRASGGRWHYIDARRPDDARRVFQREFQGLVGAAFDNVRLHLRAVKGVRVKRVRQVVPEIVELAIYERSAREAMVSLGTLDRREPAGYLLDLSLPPRPEGRYNLLQAGITYDVPAVGLAAESSDPVSFEVVYAADPPGYVNAVVARHVDEVQIDQLNQQLQGAISRADQTMMSHLARTIAKTALRLGPGGQKKTQLAHRVLAELNETGRVTRRTQLALADAARRHEESEAVEPEGDT